MALSGKAAGASARDGETKVVERHQQYQQAFQPCVCKLIEIAGNQLEEPCDCS